MKRATRLSALSLLVLASLAAGPAHAETTWTELKSNGGKFGIMFPGTPKESSQSYDTKAGNVKAIMYMLETDNGSVAFLAGYNDFPPEMVSASDPHKMLDGARDGAVRQVSGTLLDEKRITLQGSPGRELKVAAKDEHGKENVVYGRVYLIKNRLYQMLVVFPKTAVREADVKKFLTSFRLL